MKKATKKRNATSSKSSFTLAKPIREILHKVYRILYSIQMSKKLLFVFVALLCNQMSFAQKQIMIKAGMAYSNVDETVTLPFEKKRPKYGFIIGVSYDVLTKGDFVLQPGLQLTQKGYKAIANHPSTGYYSNINLSTNYLEIPLMILYRKYISETISFHVGTGPVPAYGLFGNFKSDHKLTGTSQLVSFTSDEVFKLNTFRRFDIGWDLSSGLQYNRFTFNADYNFGMMRIETNSSLRNKSFALTLGYML